MSGTKRLGPTKEDLARQQMTEAFAVTSSAQKPENGPGNLPAYQVEATLLGDRLADDLGTCLSLD
jgi:hypothetical protein